MHLEAHREPMCRGAGKSRARAQFREAPGVVGDRLQHGHGFVQYSDTAMLSHDSILSSRSLGSPESGKNELEPCHARGSHHFRIRRAARVPLPDRPWKEPEMTSPT